MKCLIVVLASAAVLAACSSTPDSSSAPSNVRDSTSQPSISSASAKSPIEAAVAQTKPGTDVAGGSFPQKSSVYFDYDSSLVKDDYKPVVAAHARYLSQKEGYRVRVEGNTDERGSREYNLALGQRRADAVKQRLTLLGVPEQRIETMSFGEEKPRSDVADESAYAESRRADIVNVPR